MIAEVVRAKYDSARVFSQDTKKTPGKKTHHHDYEKPLWPLEENGEVLVVLREKRKNFIDADLYVTVRGIAIVIVPEPGQQHAQIHRPTSLLI